MRNVIQFITGILLWCFLSQMLYAGVPDSSLQYRNIRQQQFVYEYIKEYEPTYEFQSIEEVLDFIQKVSDSWAQSVANQSEVYRRLNSYVPMWAVNTLFKNELPSGSECVIYGEIALPSFLKDVEFLKRQLHTENANFTEAAFLIRISNFAWAATQPPTYRCDLAQAQWTELKNAVRNFPGIIQEYINLGALPGSQTKNVRQSYERVKSAAENVLPYIELQDKIYQNNLSEAFATLAAEFPESGDYRYIYVEIGKRLFHKYLSNNQTNLAFAALDLLARNTTEVRLSRKKLHSMYEEVDPRIGPSRFESINAPQTSSLIRSEQRQNLGGSFFEVISGKKVKLELFNDHFLVLDFWSISCGPCIEEIPELNALSNKYKEKITLISINSDLAFGANKKEIQKFVTQNSIKYPVLLDTKGHALMNQFEVMGWPTRFLVNREGYLYMEPVEKRTKLSLKEIEYFLEQE